MTSVDLRLLLMLKKVTVATHVVGVISFTPCALLAAVSRLLSNFESLFVYEHHSSLFYKRTAVTQMYDVQYCDTAVL